MTEKRFRLSGCEGQFLVDEEKIENMAHWTANKRQIVVLLNEQHEQIQRLEDEKYRLEQTITQLLKESKETTLKKESNKYNIQPFAILKRKSDVE